MICSHSSHLNPPFLLALGIPCFFLPVLQICPKRRTSEFPHTYMASFSHKISIYFHWRDKSQGERLCFLNGAMTVCKQETEAAAARPGLWPQAGRDLWVPLPPPRRPAAQPQGPPGSGGASQAAAAPPAGRGGQSGLKETRAELPPCPSQSRSRSRSHRRRSVAGPRVRAERPPRRPPRRRARRSRRAA